MMIDAHIHVVPPQLPGVGVLHPILRQEARAVGTAVRALMTEAGLSHALAMGNLESADHDPLGVESTSAIMEFVPGLRAIGVMDPRQNNPDHLQRVEAQLKQGQVIALKAYLGYLHFAPDDPGYRPYYELAARYRLPVYFHTGDTYSPLAKLKYAHPLGIDDVAVDHPDVKFIIAHLGNPWMLDAAEVVYKNVNVWADLSGLWTGEGQPLAAEDEQDVIHDTLIRLNQAFQYAERPNRFLYGSDWPLAPMSGYQELIRTAIPREFHDVVFEENARSLFGL